MRPTTTILSLALLAAMATPANADPEPQAPEKKWYGYEIIATDLAGLFVVIAAGNSDQDPYKIYSAAAATALLWGFGGPVIHLLNGQRKTALKSLGMRVGVPVVGLVAGYALASGDSPEANVVVIGGAILVAGLIAQITDWVHFSYKPVGNSRRRALHPTVKATSGGAIVGLGGAL